GLLPRDGRELRDHFLRHIRTLGLEWRTGCAVASIDVQTRTVSFQESGEGTETLEAKALIIATGARRRTLAAEGIGTFAADVSDNATRDREWLAGREVVVVGGGDSAFEDAFLLADVCPRVTLVHRGTVFRARAAWVARVQEHPRIIVLTDSEIMALKGAGDPPRMSSARVRNRVTGAETELAAGAVVAQIGIAPNTEFLGGQLALDAEAFVRVGQTQETSVKMIYAIGDVTHPVCLSVVTAAGQGAVAAKHIAEMLRLPRGT
ncbi:MAG: NAD(P)/FAD-dependent oxidoreductase, partial [Blastocatellia bacterium]